MHRIYIVLILLVLGSCTLYPRYKRPSMEMPEQWRVPTDETSSAINSRWWEQLGDPVLDELIEETLQNNNDLRIATARIAQFKAQLGIVSSQLYPQIYGQGSFYRQKNSFALAGDPLGSNATTSSSSANPAGALGGLLPDLSQLFPAYNNNYYAAFTASYELDLWGKIRSATDASYSELLGSVDARRTVILTVISSVASAYITLRQYDWQLKISTDTLRSREDSYQLAKVRFEEGLTSELEVAQAEAERDQAAIQVIDYQTLIPQQENLITVLVGHPPYAIQRGRTVDQFTLPPEVPAGIPADILEQRPDILQAEELLKAANFRIGEARALYFPDIALTGYYGSESAALHNLFLNPSNTWQWMANLLQPIFTGWKITNTVDLTKARKQEAIYNYLQVILTALQEVDDALIGHANSKRAAVVLKQRVKALQSALHLATLQYQNGLVDYLNVLDAERLLFNAQLDLAQGQADVYLTLVNIYKALGGGWVIDAENMMKEEWEVSCSS